MAPRVAWSQKGAAPFRLHVEAFRGFFLRQPRCAAGCRLGGLGSAHVALRAPQRRGVSATAATVHRMAQPRQAAVRRRRRPGPHLRPGAAASGRAPPPPDGVAAAGASAPPPAGQAAPPPSPRRERSADQSRFPDPRGCRRPVPPRSSIIAPCFEKQGGVSVVEPQTYLYYIQLKPQPAVAEHMGALRRQQPRRRCRTTSSACGRPTSSTTSRSTSRTTTSQRRGRQDGRLQHGGAPARQDRRLRRLEEGRETKIDDKLKKKGLQIRLDTFIDPAWSARSTASSATCTRRRASSTPRSSPKSRRCRAARSWSTSPSTWTKGRRSRSRAVDFVGNKAISDSAAEAQMKDNKGAEPVAPRSSISARHLPGNQVRRRRREGRRSTTAITATSRRTSASRS